ncbi:MAG TPA: serine/threonine-protein kinase [Kofleriaceae bacterium]|nr:serine/threonine-protein kinase [Kofleriaceae bacterium]
MEDPDDDRPDALSIHESDIAGEDRLDTPIERPRTERDPPLAADETSLVPGTEVGGYAIDGVLGRGGMGMVYAATHPLIGKRAAIKVLRPALSRDRKAVERFVLEARAVNRIGHPNIVDIFAFGMLPDGRSYYVMDLLQGESLRARLRRGPLHISEAVSVIDETASALIAAHSKGIVHRDLKPDNVFMVAVPGRWPEVKLLDWGLAKLGGLAPGIQRTLAGEIMGTPVYMSPEQARGAEDLDHRTDIYALGVMSYELLIGQVPYKRGTSIDTLLAHAEDPVPSLLAAVPSLPIELAQLIEAMLAKEPDGRPTLAAVRAVIKRLRATQIPTMTAAGLQIMAQGQVHPDDALPGPATELDVLSQQVTAPRGSRPKLDVPAPAPTPLPLPLPPPLVTPMPGGSLPPQVYQTTTPGYSVPVLQAQAQLRAAQGSIPPPQQRPSATQPARGSRRWLVIALVAVVASAIGVTLLVYAG